MILLLGSLYGVLTPQNVPVAQVGPMQIAPFKTGLALYQDYRGYYYSFSPFNDYLISRNGSRTALITQEELKNKKYTSSYNQNNFNKILSTIQNYLQITTPSIQFKAHNQIIYTSKNSNNKLSVIRSFNPLNNNQTLLTGTTISFRDTNFIYDSADNLYTFQTEEDQDFFVKLYCFRLGLIPPGQLRLKIPGKTLFIFNPYTTGVIVIKAAHDQSVWLNRNAQLIEIEQKVEPKNNNYTTTIDLEVYSNPREALKTL